MWQRGRCCQAMSTIIFAVGDSGFPRPGEGREGNPKLEGVHQPNILAIFSENYMELKNWTEPEQLRIPSAPLDTPMF